MNEDIIGTPGDRKKSIEDLKKGKAGEPPSHDFSKDVNSFSEWIKSHADPEYVDRAESVFDRFQSFLTEGLTPHFNEAVQQAKNASGWQKVAVLAAAAGATPVIF